MTHLHAVLVEGVHSALDVPLLPHRLAVHMQSVHLMGQ
jgi:hypothetical protein